MSNIWHHNDGVLGEQLAQQLTKELGLKIKILQNNSKHGVDLYSYDPVKNEYLVIEVKSSWAGNFRLSKDQQKGPNVYLKVQADKAAGGQGFWRSENTPLGIQDEGQTIVDKLRFEKASVKGIKMEVAIPKSGESGIPNLTIKEWH